MTAKKQKNDKQFLHYVIALLEREGIITWIFGGWAEELLGVTGPRPHKDIDLFYPADDFSKIDECLSEHPDFEEITLKRFYHKRAFLYKGVMIELFLIQKNKSFYYTNFWRRKKCIWPKNLFINRKERIVSAEAISFFRANYEQFKYENNFNLSIDLIK